MEKERKIEKKAFKIYGLAVEKYIDVQCYGSNCDFEYSPEVFQRYIVLAREAECPKHCSPVYVKLELTKISGECGSGWTTATWGCCRTDVAYERINYPMTHKPKGDIFVILHRDYSNFSGWYLPDADDYDEDEYNENHVVSYSSDGGDSYYPCGGIHVDLTQFEELPRAMDKRPVWIFKGKSGLGKSSIGVHLEGLRVFETDSVDELPEAITDDVIVLGNRSKWTVEDVKKHIFDVENTNVITCTFKN